MTTQMQEKPVQIIINGRAAMIVMTSENDPINLVVGRLYTERVIKTYADITSMHADGNQTSVITTNPFEILLSRKIIFAGCGNTPSILDLNGLDDIVSDMQIPERQLCKGTKLLPETRWHSGALFAEDGTLLTAAVDITSQNVTDRIIGWGLARGTKFSKTYLLFRGNIVTETIRKAIIAKIPLLGTDAETTIAAVVAADNAKMALYKITKDAATTLSRTSRHTS